jgi:hypothetical protein
MCARYTFLTTFGSRILATRSAQAKFRMLLPDNIYKRIPQIWLFMGIMFLLFGLIAGSDFRYFGAYMLLGLVSIVRSIWLYSVRQRVVRRAEVTVLTETQKMDRNFR